MTESQKYWYGIVILGIIILGFIIVGIIIKYSTTKYIPRNVVFCSSWQYTINDYLYNTSVRPSRRLAPPSKIFLSYKSAHLVPEYIWNQYCKYAKGYEIEFYNDEACSNIIKLFGQTVVDCYNSLSLPAHKCDLWRYCVLYIYGGIYFDIKTILTRPVSEMFPHSDRMYTVFSKMSKSIYQGIICVPPAHPIIGDAISNILHNKPTKLTYLQVTQQLYTLIENYLGYEPRIGVNYSQLSTIELFQEEETNNCVNRDRHNHCQLLALNESNETMCIIRDHKYPYEKKQEIVIPPCIKLVP